MKFNGRVEKKKYWSKARSWPFYLLILYFSFDYIRPHDIYPALQNAKIGFIIGALIILTWIAKGNKRALKEPLIRYYFIFIFLMGIGVLYATNTYWVARTTGDLLIYLFVGVLPVAAFLEDPAKLRLFFRFWIFIHVLLGIYGITHHGRGPGSTLADENDLALALNMCIPYAFFLFLSPSTNLKEKSFYLLSVCILVYAVIATDSRGGFIGLVAVAFGVIFYSKNVIRNFILIILSIPMFLYVASPSYITEMETIQNTMDSTRQDRLYSWRRGWEMFVDHPVFGVGAGNYPWNVEKYELKSADYDARTHRLHGGRVAHSIYFTLLPELGLSGVFIYSVILFGLFRKLRKTGNIREPEKQATNEQIELELLSHAMTASLVSYLVCGAFISVLYYQHFWYLMGFAIALDYALQKSKKKEDDYSAKTLS